MLRKNIVNKIQAISIGITSTILLGLFNQLLLIMAIVGYNSLMKTSPALAPWLPFFTYAMGALGFFIVMSSAGLITAMASHREHYYNTIIVALSGSSISLYLSLKEEFFTPLALIFVTLGIIFATLGCWAWRKHDNKLQSNNLDEVLVFIPFHRFW